MSKWPPLEIKLTIRKKQKTRSICLLFVMLMFIKRDANSMEILQEKSFYKEHT
jgi:hypothetical protein